MGILRNILQRLFRPDPEPEPEPDDVPEPIDEDMVSMHNSARRVQNLPPLHVHAQLQAAAQNHADWMAKHQKLSHDANSGFQARIVNAGYTSRTAGENIAQAPTAPATFNMWMDSRGHRQNILGPYKDFGVASCRNQQGQIYWCAVFAAPQS